MCVCVCVSEYPTCLHVECVIIIAALCVLHNSCNTGGKNGRVSVLHSH